MSDGKGFDDSADTTNLMEDCNNAMDESLLGSMLSTKKIHRVQSPSSINTFLHCPRKYYYQYRMLLPGKPSIHLVKGSVVHSVLEDFFEKSLKSEDYFKEELRIRAASLLKKHWVNSKAELDLLNMQDEEQVHFDDVAIMISNWLEHFLRKLRTRIDQGKSPKEAFALLTPVREREYVSNEYAIHGFIDAIEEIDNEIKLVDYKTSKRNDISQEYYLQLAIYALMYRANHGRLPDQVALHFLRHGEKCVCATDKMVEHAIAQIDFVHNNTLSEYPEDYPKKTGPLCKWRTGCCDFYDKCFLENKWR